MTAEFLESIIAKLVNAGWHVGLHDPIQTELPLALVARYPTIPSDYVFFLQSVAYCVNGTETVWFLCREDFDGTSPSAFRWDEWEKMTLESTDSSSMLASQIHGFWTEHIPIMSSVKAGYAYAALDVAPRLFGYVVAGFEPEFEEPTVICDSFGAFLERLSLDVERPVKLQEFKHFT